MREPGDIAEDRRVSLSICVVGCGEQARKVLDEAFPVLDEATLYFASEYVEDAQRYNDTLQRIEAWELARRHRLPQGRHSETHLHSPPVPP